MQAASSTKPIGLRLGFLDGMRAIACLYVLLFHVLTVRLDGPAQLSWPLDWLKAVFGYGHLSVVTFIVLSGFSLMLPVVRSGKLELPAGFRHYISRRARRILPPYYASIMLALVPLLAMKSLGAGLGVEQVSHGALSAGSLVSHLLLVHNLSFDWVYRINGPAWSVATEWQIYFLFPFLLLPLWRRVGPLATIAISYALGALPVFVLAPEHSFFWACPWFAGSFAMGMYGAAIFYSPRAPSAAARFPWWPCTIGSFAVVCVLTAAGKVESWPYPVVDFAVSVFAFCLAAAAAQYTTRGADTPRNLLLELVQSKPLVRISGFSYSLYLIQHPFLRLTEKLVNRLHLPYQTALWLHLLAVTPLLIALAWLFAEVFERPFTGGGVLWPWFKERKERKERLMSLAPSAAETDRPILP